MIHAVFTDEMMELLRAMKGKVFKSYQCIMDNRWHRTEGNVRINLGRSSIDLNCYLHDVDYFGEPEEMAFFTCTSADPKSEFRPYVAGDAQVYMVDEPITGIELVRDHVVHNNGECVIDMDIALVVQTKFHTITFSRGIWYSETIVIAVSNPGEAPASLEPVEDLWYDDAPYEEPSFTTEVERAFIVL